MDVAVPVLFYFPLNIYFWLLYKETKIKKNIRFKKLSIFCCLWSVCLLHLLINTFSERRIRGVGSFNFIGVLKYDGIGEGGSMPHKNGQVIVFLKTVHLRGRGGDMT